MLDRQGEVRALRPIVRDIDADVLSPEGLRFLAAVDVDRLPLVPAPMRLGPPVAQVREIIAIGLNYRGHAHEANLPVPQEPVVFSKSTSSISGPYDDIILPFNSTKVDWEIELGVVIGSKTRRVTAEQARSCIAGYVMVNDVSERSWQLERGGQWQKGKGFDTFTPIGPWLVTTSEIADPGSLTLTLAVNDQQRQHGHTEDLIFSVDRLVSYCSEFMTLMPGDLIVTGTPAGVGIAMKPPQFLAPGDRIDMAISGLGHQQHLVRAEVAEDGR